MAARRKAVTHRKKAVRKLRKARTQREPAAPAKGGRVQLRASHLPRPIELPLGKPMQEAAMRWSYVARYRKRWQAMEGGAEGLTRQIRAQLADLGLSDADLRALAGAPTVEVGVAWTTEAEGWEARVMPWEFLLPMATHPYRHGSLTVVRRLERARGAAARPVSDNRKVLYVEAAPGALREHYEFTGERRLILQALGDDPGKEVRLLLDPSLEQLAAVARELAPEVVYVTGFDNHLAAETLAAEVPGRPDGLALASAGNGGPAYTPRTRVAEALTAAAHPPRLVVFNVPYSGLRMASECVGAGAGAALGFVDTFDDALAELFFGEFLRQWRSSRRSRSDGALLAAFTAAWNVLREPDADLRGTGIVLWSAEPLLEKGERALDEAPALRSERAGAGRGERGKATPRAPAAGPADLVVQVTPLPAFNYALLHNDRPLFDRFALIPPPDQPATDVEVQVVLHVGVDSFPFRKHIALVDRSTSLAHEIRVPLTSSGLRQLGERVFTR